MVALYLGWMVLAYIDAFRTFLLGSKSKVECYFLSAKKEPRSIILKFYLYSCVKYDAVNPHIIVVRYIYPSFSLLWIKITSVNYNIESLYLQC